MSETQDRKDADLMFRVSEARFDDREVREYLDDQERQLVVAKFGPPTVTKHYAETPGWSQGDGRPALASSDPAVMCAIGRCASWRQRAALPGPSALPGSVHPTECGWCQYPLAEMLAACSWSVWNSQHLLSEVEAWLGKDRSVYTRAGRHDVYENPVWAEFAALTQEQRAGLVREAVEASRG